MRQNGPIFFVSDAHLGAPIPGKERRETDLFSFFESLRHSAQALYIVGDLFDFWIDYPHAIRPDYFDALYWIKQLIESGVDVHYMAGNHDFALGRFLSDRLGVTIHQNHYEAVLQSRRVHIYHGDGVIASDWGYRLLRKILRNTFNQRLYKLLHPDLGIPLAHFCSMSSRKYLRVHASPDKLDEYRKAAAKIISRGNDIVVFGHTHSPELTTVGAGIYCNTGEWIRRYTYARLENGMLSLHEYLPERDDRELVL
jgi:UDP-2,3-diacylglucosamine hydrolase